MNTEIVFYILSNAGGNLNQYKLFLFKLNLNFNNLL